MQYVTFSVRQTEYGGGLKMDNYTLWERHDREEQAWLDSLPKCCLCGEPIQQDMAVRIGNDWYCDQCLDENREAIA